MQNLYHLTYRNLANVASILGVLPLCLLFGADPAIYLIPLIIYCNVMDDLDGILAAKLHIGSQFGARLDNVCDSITHSIILMFVGMSFGGICTIAALVATAVVVLRSVSRLDPNATPGIGSPTNELVRHVFFILLLGEQFAFDASPFLIVAFVLNAITMALPCKLPFMIRSMTKSAVSVGLVNVALLVAWLAPFALPVIAAAFIGSYLYSLGWALWQAKNAPTNQPQQETRIVEPDQTAKP
ncbi:MAG: CDP-alcohol phosphatidyltransferase family protein [Rubripirellula sp.]